MSSQGKKLPIELAMAAIWMGIAGMLKIFLGIMFFRGYYIPGLLVLSLVLIVYGLLQIAASYGLFRFRAWAWWLAISLAILDIALVILKKWLLPPEIPRGPVVSTAFYVFLTTLFIIALLKPSIRSMFFRQR